MLSVKETADQLDISTSSVRRAADQHRLLCSRVNGERRFRPEDVTAFSARRDRGEIDDESANDHEADVETLAEPERVHGEGGASHYLSADPAIRAANVQLELERIKLETMKAKSKLREAKNKAHEEERAQRGELLMARLRRGSSARDQSVLAEVSRCVYALDDETLFDEGEALARMRDAEVIARHEFDEEIEAQSKSLAAQRQRRIRTDGIIAPLVSMLRAAGWDADVISAAVCTARDSLDPLDEGVLVNHGVSVAREAIDRLVAMVNAQRAAARAQQPAPAPMYPAYPMYPFTPWGFPTT